MGTDLSGRSCACWIDCVKKPAQADPQWLWKGRRVDVYDGSTVTMPDTPENPRAYPQPVIQKPGLGLLIGRTDMNPAERNGDTRTTNTS